MFDAPPQEGEVWPNIPVEVNIVFKPEEAKLYQETVYCDITGECLPTNYFLSFTNLLNSH